MASPKLPEAASQQSTSNTHSSVLTATIHYIIYYKPPFQTSMLQSISKLLVQIMIYDFSLPNRELSTSVLLRVWPRLSFRICVAFV